MTSTRTTSIISSTSTNDSTPIRTAIGIDLGTTYSCAAIFKNNKVKIIVNDQGNRTTPSYVAFTDTDRLVGDAAYYQAQFNPRNTIFGAKRLIGREFDDDIVQSDIKHLPYKVVDVNNRPYIEVDACGDMKKLPAEEVGSMILAKLKEAAESALDREVTDAVITVPAYFNDSQRQSTKDAATIAGLNVLRIINEPTAAALAYGLNKLDDDHDNDFMKKRPTATGLAVQTDLSEGRNILVYDLGGGTFDVSVLNIREGAFRVKATDGDTHLGGEDFDNRLMEYFARGFKKITSKDVASNETAIGKLKKASEQAKRVLSTNSMVRVQVDSLVDGVNLDITITRAEFEDLCSDLFKATLDTVKSVLTAAGLEKYAIDEIILVGGSTRIPKIQKLVTEYFGDKNLNKSINADEAVAYGAAIQASMLINDETSTITNHVSLQDVNSQSLGIRVVGGEMSIVLPRNTPLPASASKTYYNSQDYQTMRKHAVFEGEQKLVKDNHLLGEFDLRNITKAKKGEAPVLVTFSLDRNGILNVSAVDQGTGSKGSITVKNESNRLSQDQIKELISNGEVYKQNDQEELMRVESRNDLESYVYTVREAFEDHKTELSPSYRSFVEREIKSTREWIENTRRGSIEEYKYKHDWFKQNVHPIMFPYLTNQ
ncbi:chaperone [Scheffersomyces coipomensis]|uniref:chaperone n=1 Tax=Scheffersomyces coipomensis TaxID=1788519 RepID=UPI00315CB274